MCIFILKGGSIHTHTYIERMTVSVSSEPLSEWGHHSEKKEAAVRWRDLTEKGTSSHIIIIIFRYI